MSARSSVVRLIALVVFLFTAATDEAAGAQGVAATPKIAPRTLVTGTALLGEGFSASATPANAWAGFGDACLTAGTSATPATSLPACAATTRQDADGQGALQLTTGLGNQAGMVVAKAPLATAGGLQVTFTDYAFGGTTPGADGVVLFFADAAQPLPGLGAGRGSTLGYAGTASQPGLAGAYVGVAFDEYGNFSNAYRLTGGVGNVPETIAVRGAATNLWPYLGGATNAAGAAARLPFAFDQPQLAVRPTNAPVIRAILTPAGALSVAIDRHDGAGFVTYYTQTIVGIAGQPPVPAHVYVGVSAATGGDANVHQVSGLVVSSLANAPVSGMLQSESFAAAATGPSAWSGFGDACLTAGNAATPATSLPACGASAMLDPPGSGALQLNAGGTYRSGMVVSRTPLPTANGLQISFTDDAFNGTSPGADGISFFLVDAARGLPAVPASDGGALGYASKYNVPGLAGGYVGVALDEYGNFSNPGDGHTGGPGRVPETIGVRGSATTNWQYLGGTTNAAGAAASLPFTWDQPALATRPLAAPTIRAILTPAGILSVAVDRHTGSGFATYYSQRIVGVGGQPAVPAQVYFGLSSSTGKFANRHQIAGLTIASANLAAVSAAAQNPPSLISTNGSLVFNVATQLNAQTGRPQYVYNGATIPPTLRLLPGDTLVVNLTNALPVPPPGSGYTNATNLHYHGLHVSPQAPGDDSIDMLAAPGQSLHYTLHVPLDHPPGLYWYHAHAHGEAERQTLAGLSGALIIDGIAAYTPQVANMTERVLVVRDAPPAGGVLPTADRRQVAAMNWAMRHGVAMHGRAEVRAASTPRTTNPYVRTDATYRQFVRPLAASTHCIASSPEAASKTLTLNGLSQPVLPIAPGEQQFWRLVNAGADTYLDVSVDAARLQVIGVDGVPLGSGIGTPASLTVSHWVVPPASRVEFIITGPPAGTLAYLRTACFDSGSAGAAMPAAILASIDASGTAATARAIRSAAARVSPHAKPHRFGTLAGIRATPVSKTRTLYYSDQNTIDGVAYDPAAPPQLYAQSGTVEEWTIQNNSSQVHTFHIHQVHFVVEAIDGTPQAQQFVMDNVNVPAAGAAGPGSVKLLLDFTDPTIVGTFLLHCHILSHEDAGMMAKIRIGTAPPLGLSTTNVAFSSPAAALQTVSISGGAAPFSVTGCNGVASAAVNAARLTIVPTGAGACVLTIADASTPSITATIAISVAQPAIVAVPTALSFASLTAAVQTATLVGGTAPYRLAGCAGIVNSAIAGAVVSVAPLAVGSCSIAIVDVHGAPATLPVTVNVPAAGGNLLDALTFHQNAMRTGWNQNETVLTAATVKSANFGQVGTLAPPAGMPALAKVYAQPLFVTNELAVDGRRHDLVIVAGANDLVYAFDETSRSVVWHRDFTNVAAGVRQQLWSDTGCADVNPDVGIVGTPVIDRTRDAVYVVVATMENGVPYTRLHAIGLGTGSDLIAPATIGGSVALATGGTASITSLRNMNRSALLEANGNIYVALGSHCDQGASSVHGWISAYNATTLSETGSLVDLANANNGSNSYLGSVWMSGFGPAADAAGNVYFATGNGPFNGSTDFGMSVLKVPGNLNLVGATFFTPIQAAEDSEADADLGAGGVLLLPDQTGALPHLLFAGGKCSANNVGCLKYLLDRDALGGQRTGNAGALWSADVGAQLLGGPAYFADSSGAQHLVFGTGEPLATYTLRSAPFGLALQSSASVGCLECRDSGSQPIVSSNGTQAGSAVVWALKTPGNGGGTIALYAFDALALGAPLFTAPAGVWNAAPGAPYIGGALISPLVANGHVYVPGQGGVSVFGLH